jgi:hypothetical protein
MGRARQINYLETRGWARSGKDWACPRHTVQPQTLSRAVHHQLTEDLCRGLAAYGWKVVAFSERGYARLWDPEADEECSLPAALRRQARRSKRRAGELAYSLFLAAMVNP